MAVLISLNVATDSSMNWTEAGELYLIQAFNKLPREITAENIMGRSYRAWLLRLVDETNAKARSNYDLLDIVLKLQQLRKSGRLRNSSAGLQPTIGDDDGSDPMMEGIPE